MQLPAVTCIIPTHLRPSLLPRTLSSVAQQSVSVAEVIVVDDADDQETRELCEKSSLPLTYVAAGRQALGTAGSSRNIGASLATSDVLAFLDDDDEWDPSFVSRLLDRMESGGADVVSCWVAYQKGADRTVALQPDPLLTADDAIVSSGVTGSNTLIRAAAFRRFGGFDPTLPVKNDNDFIVRALDAGLKFDVVPRDLVTRHSHDLGHLTSRTKRRADGLKRYQAKYAERMTNTQAHEMRRLIHAASWGPDQPWRLRILHAALHFADLQPREMVSAVQRRFRRNGVLWN